MSQIIVELIGGPYDGRRIHKTEDGTSDFMFYQIFKDKKIGDTASVTSQVALNHMNQFPTYEEYLEEMKKQSGPQSHLYRVEDRVEDGETDTVKVRYEHEKGRE